MRDRGIPHLDSKKPWDGTGCNGCCILQFFVPRRVLCTHSHHPHHFPIEYLHLAHLHTCLTFPCISTHGPTCYLLAHAPSRCPLLRPTLAALVASGVLETIHPQPLPPHVAGLSSPPLLLVCLASCRDHSCRGQFGSVCCSAQLRKI